MQYATSSHCVYYHRYHIVWATKYRYNAYFTELGRSFHRIVGTDFTILGGRFRQVS